jgi:RNase H-like domain found in reverse transcriptase
MGGVLLQQLEDGLWHPITFRLESMVKVEQNYEIYNKEMLAVIHSLEDWRHYYEGLPELFTIVTDHCNLEYWQTAQNLTCRQAQWSLYLSRFDFHLTHKPGTTITQADPLSQLSTHQVMDTDDNQGQIVLKPNHFATTVAASTKVLDTLEQDI